MKKKIDDMTDDEILKALGLEDGELDTLVSGAQHAFGDLTTEDSEASLPPKGLDVEIRANPNLL